MSAGASKTVRRRRLAIVTSHPIQYQAPLFRSLAERLDLNVFFAHRASAADQAKAGFGTAFTWDTDLLEGYSHVFLPNLSDRPGLSEFGGCDTPGIGAALANAGPDAILVMGWHYKSYIQAILAAKRLGVPVMVRGDSHLHTSRPIGVRVLKSILYPPALRVFDAALYVGARSREYYRAYGFPERRLVFSPHCVDNEWFRRRATVLAGRELRRKHGIDSEVRLVLYAGKLSCEKRPLDVVSGLAKLRCDGAPVEFLVAGTGALEDELRHLCEASNLPLHALGFQNQTAMPGVYAAADVLVLPGQETWGLVCNEALACGVPIVVSDGVGCGPDLAADARVGRVYKLGDADALAHALGSVLGAPANDAAIRSAVDPYGLDTAVEGVESAIDQVAHAARI